jgi:hypothetical protein
VDVLRWAALEVDAGGLDVATLTGRVAEAVNAALADADGRPILARLTLTGATELHGTLLGDVDGLAAECRNAAIEADGALWVESVRVLTRPLALAKDDVLAPVRAAFAAGLDDSELVKGLLDDFAALRLKLPTAARGGLDLPEDAAALRILADEAWQFAADVLGSTEAG